jgi:hypothetical protein
VPPIWLHFGLSLAACAGIGEVARRQPHRPWLPWIGYGLVVGAVGPDTDLILSSLATAVSGFDTTVGKDLHRTFTHGVALVAVLLLAGAALWTRRPRLAPLLVGTGIGVAALHILPDLFYLVPVKVWAPFSMHEVGPYGPIDKANFTAAENNAINAIDFLGESASLLGSWWLARRAGLADRFTRSLPWLAGLNAAIFLPLLILVAPHTTYDQFLIWAYVPGIVFIVVVTVLVPWRLREAFLVLGGKRRSDGLPAPLQPPTSSAI